MDAGDRISDLPDELLHHAMSFLPARDVVRTCVLSTRWRHLWVSMPYLSVDTGDFINQRSFIKFVTSLLLSRGCGPLDSFRLDANGPGIFLENFRDTACLWICHALRSNVHTLSIMDHELKEEGEGESEERPDAFWLGHCPFMSLYLKKLHLRGVSVDKCFAKNLFSGCTALEDLDMINCVILATEFSSTTLKRLSIDYHGFCRSEGYDYEDIVINMPSLISLHIGALCAMLSLVDVQSLITASVCLDDQNATFAGACNILGALSSVKNLELLFPVCVLFGSEHFALCRSIAAVDCPFKETMRRFQCEKLKKVEIICPQGDRRVGMLVTILLTRIISPPEISVKPSPDIPWNTAYFSYKWTSLG
ncbi:unnamed protein product [Miscanthus lutarioriparius]|uniref:F-box domain-containing protein n=1 Tax=Miscanthus lutarioriparius TaxID=422564 RepID=A0A811PVJ7_9POAL|nr:unnamed protein product [Miscanthus lutarioriparius]